MVSLSVDRRTGPGLTRKEMNCGGFSGRVEWRKGKGKRRGSLLNSCCPRPQLHMLSVYMLPRIVES